MPKSVIPDLFEPKSGIIYIYAKTKEKTRATSGVVSMKVG